MKVVTPNPSFQDLLDHAGWIRALARSLVSDPSLADDVVQDTWVAALEKPPVQDENLRGWLATVVRNAVRMRGRSAARRADHETRVAAERDTSLPSSAELAERIETQQRLAAQVLELEEPYRETVLLRYYEGLNSAEIARRTGTKASTVRWRLSQGLEQLRGRLDDDFGGDRAAWLGLLLPLVEKDATLVASAAAGTGLLSGILAMNLGIKILLAGAVVALAYVLSPFGAKELTPSGGAAPLSPSAAVELQRAPQPAADAALDAIPAEDVDRVALSSEGPDSTPVQVESTGVRARLVDPEGDAIPGAQFVVPNYDLGEILSDSNGVIELRLTEEQFDQMPRPAARFEHDHYVPHYLVVAWSRGEIVDLGEFTLQPAGTIEGRVVDAAGRPVPEAWVRVAKEPKTSHEEVLRRTADSDIEKKVTDEQGRFLLSSVPVGDVHLWAGAVGEETAPTHEAVLSDLIEVRRGQTSSGIELQLGIPKREEYLAGVVVNPQGEPVARAEVRYNFNGKGRSGNGSIFCDTEGRFTLAYVPNVPWELRARDVANRYGEVVEREARGGEDLVLRLTERAIMELTVRGEGSLHGLGVWGSDEERAKLLIPKQGVVFEENVARFNLPDEPFVLSVTAAGHDVTQVGPFNGLDAPRNLEVTLTSLPGIHGRVVDSAGAPLKTAYVALYKRVDRRTEHNGFLVRMEDHAAAGAKTDEAGEFSITLRQDGEFYLRAEAPGFAPAEQGPYTIDPKLGREGLEITMGEGGAIEGIVTPPVGSAPADLIVAVSRGDGKAKSKRVQADGRYRFHHLTPGPWHVKLVETMVGAGGSTTSISGKPFDESEIPNDVIVEEGKTTRHDLNLEGTATLVGTVRFDDAPARDWRVELVEPGNHSLAGTLASAGIDREGKFELKAPNPGRYTARLVSQDPLAFVLSEELTLAPGANRWDLAYSTGTLVLENVTPAGRGSGVDVVVGEDGARLLLAPLLTAPTGVVTLENIPAVQGRIARFPLAAASLEVDPRTAGTTRVTFEIVVGEVTTVTLPE